MEKRWGSTCISEVTKSVDELADEIAMKVAQLAFDELNKKRMPNWVNPEYKFTDFIIMSEDIGFDYQAIDFDLGAAIETAWKNLQPLEDLISRYTDGFSDDNPTFYDMVEKSFYKILDDVDRDILSSKFEKEESRVNDIYKYFYK